mmetsp:Transcript_89219/g.174594  ORF Transcript_89219/g.174594 Transcript_89219/m.174594 type:complete len:245 (+) Transcript_89219:964-1698(+)
MAIGALHADGLPREVGAHHGGRKGAEGLNDEAENFVAVGGHDGQWVPHHTQARDMQPHPLPRLEAEARGAQIHVQVRGDRVADHLRPHQGHAARRDQCVHPLHAEDHQGDAVEGQGDHDWEVAFVHGEEQDVQNDEEVADCRKGVEHLERVVAHAPRCHFVQQSRKHADQHQHGPDKSHEQSRLPQVLLDAFDGDRRDAMRRAHEETCRAEKGVDMVRELEAHAEGGVHAVLAEETHRGRGREA